MRTVLLCVLLVAMVFCVSSCLSKADQIRLNRLTVDQKEKVDNLRAELAEMYLVIEKQTAEIKKKIEAGTVSLSDGKEYIELLRSEMTAAVDKVDRQIRDTRESYTTEKDRLMEKGESRAEYYIGLLISVVATFTGVNVYRSRKHPLTKEIT